MNDAVSKGARAAVRGTSEPADRPLDDGVVVEFAGMSCSGKSTLIAQVERLFLEEGYEVARHVAGGAERLGWGRQPSRERRSELVAGLRVAPGLALLLATLDRESRRFKQVARYAQALAYTRKLPDGPGIHLLDEGPMKRVPKGHGWKPWQARVLARSVPRADRLVHVVCDTDTRIARLRETGRGGHGYTDDELRQQERNTLTRQRRLIEGRASRSIEVDPTADRDAARRVHDWILGEPDRTRRG